MVQVAETREVTDMDSRQTYTCEVSIGRCDKRGTCVSYRMTIFVHNGKAYMGGQAYTIFIEGTRCVTTMKQGNDESLKARRNANDYSSIGLLYGVFGEIRVKPRSHES